jgi:Holliday junction resolvasome RuvABC endonuclease subunit
LTTGRPCGTIGPVELGGAIDFGTAVVGVDPGSISTGVCLMDGAGAVVGTYSIKAPAGAVLGRMAYIHGGVRRVFDSIAPKYRAEAVLVAIEDGVFRARPKVCSMIGEVRGLVMAEAWRHGWRVRKVAPVSWKTLLSAAERKMKKDAQYVAYWDRKLSLACRTADEIDAVMIAAYGLKGKTA